jgi:hypothetical protein
MRKRESWKREEEGRYKEEKQRQKVMSRQTRVILNDSS